MAIAETPRTHSDPLDGMAPVIVLGGVGTSERERWWYTPLLDDGQDWDMNLQDRYFPPPERGLGDPDEMRKRLEEQILIISQRLGRPVVAVGHSLGAVFGTEIALDNPDVFSDVICAAGAHNGKRYRMPAAFLLRQALGNPSTAKDLEHNSELTEARRSRIAEEWPESVGLHLVTTPLDDLLPFPHGLKMELPNGRQPDRKVIAMPLPGTNFMLRLITGTPNVSSLPSLRPAFHADIVRHPAFIGYARGVQLGMAGVVELQFENSTHSAEKLSPALVASAA